MWKKSLKLIQLVIAVTQGPWRTLQHSDRTIADPHTSPAAVLAKLGILTPKDSYIREWLAEI